MSNHLYNDLRCPDDHREYNVFYARSAGPPPCPECGKDRSVFYATRAEAGEATRDHTVGGEFQSFVFDGKRVTSKEEWHAIKADYARQAGVPVSDIVETPVSSRAQKNARLDDIRHAAYEMRRKNGFDGQTYQRYVQEQNERKSARVRTGWTR